MFPQASICSQGKRGRVSSGARFLPGLWSHVLSGVEYPGNMVSGGVTNHLYPIQRGVGYQGAPTLYLYPTPWNYKSGRYASYWNAFLFHFLPPSNEVWGKVIFLHLSVILFTGGGGDLGRYPPGRYTPWAGTASWQIHPLGQVHPHREQYMLGDTDNKREVRILLKCILVIHILAKK